MKRIIVAMAAAIGIGTAGTAHADPGGYAPPNANGGGMSLPSFAQMAGPNTLLGAGECPAGRPPDRYGLHPCLKKLFHIPTANPGMAAGNGHNPLQNPANWQAGGYGMGGPALNPYGFPPNGGGMGMPGGGMGMPGMGMPGMGMPGMGMPGGPQGGGMPGAPGMYPPMMQGTLVFPYNNLIRSPRDFFMTDVSNK